MTVGSPVPESLRPRTRKICLEGYRLSIDIGFHPHEIGQPQTLLVTVEAWIDESSFARNDLVAAAWNYDDLHRDIAGLTAGRRFNLQEAVASEIYDLVASRAGVLALRVATRKPDIYPDCHGVGVDLASF